jgi:hypothetical protein
VSDLARKLQDIDDHPEVAAEYRRRAPERIREAYSWERITDQYEEFFLRLAAGENAAVTHSSVTAAEARFGGAAEETWAGSSNERRSRTPAAAE